MWRWTSYLLVLQTKLNYIVGKNTNRKGQSIQALNKDRVPESWLIRAILALF